MDWRPCLLILLISVLVNGLPRSKRGASSISIGPPIVMTEPGNHTVEVGQDFQFYCKIKANPLAHVAMKFNPVNAPISVIFPRFGSSPTGGNTIVLLDLINLNLNDEGRYTCFAENKYGTVESHGWLKFAKACSCNDYGVAYSNKPCDDDGNCVCRENIGGERCDKCQEGFYNFPYCMPCDCNPWGTVDESLSCNDITGECNCLPDRTTIDPIKCDGCPPGEYFNAVTGKCQPCRCYKEGSLSDECDYQTGACDCKENYTGDKCANCKDGFFGRRDGCKPCDCVIENTLYYDKRCDSVTGQCNCKNGLDYTDTRTCAACPENTYLDSFSGQCEPCGCDVTGTERCNSKGECECRENFTGIKCDECEADYWGYQRGICEPCNCNPYGTIAGTTQCDQNGNCPCKSGNARINYRKCDGCPEGQTLKMNVVVNLNDGTSDCEDCNCNPKGSLTNQCDLYTGQCDCGPNVYGQKCDNCQPGSYGLNTLGQCLPCNCDPYNSYSLQCDPDSGQCPCYENIIFTDPRTCSGCPLGQYSKIPGTCEPCECNMWGSISQQCDNTGQCICQSTVQGLKCDECKPGFFNFQPGGCEPCNCNPWGVVEDPEPCDAITGQCDCKSGQTQISSRTCDGCPPGFYVNVNNPNECISCPCHPFGSIDDSVCDLYSGKCDCGPNVMGDRCDECEPGFYGLNIVGIQACIPCQCDPEGSESAFCDMFGQCQCKPGYGSVDPRTCEGCPNGMYSVDGTCVPCGCDPRGSISNLCTDDGTCFCASGVSGKKCDQCENGMWFGDAGYLGCIPCGCDGSGTYGADGWCDVTTGQCNCIEESNFYFLDPRRCEPCGPYQYAYNRECWDCGCNPYGSESLLCFEDGACPCKDGAYGIKCDECQDGYYNLEEGCIPCNCNTQNTLGGLPSCDENGQCFCKNGFIYSDPRTCTTCGEGTYQLNGQCQPCNCKESGSVNGTCDNLNGQCYCLEGVTGRDCSQCEGDTYGIESGQGCKPCDCNPWGTINKSKKCDQVTGQCECIDGRTRYEPRTCDGCRSNFLYNEYLDPVTRECVDCDCHETGSQRYNCTTYEGKCDCNPGIVGDKCNTIAEAKDEVVEEGEPATVTCALVSGDITPDRTLWVGPDGCESSECGSVVEQPTFLSLTLKPEEDTQYTCRMIFGDVVQDNIAHIDVIAFDLPSVTVQRGSIVTLTASVTGMAEPPARGIDWRHKGNSCSAKKCKIDGHAVTDEEVMVDGQHDLISEIYIGEVTESIRYSAMFKYNGKIFRKFAVITVYDCNCNPEGSQSTACDPVTLQCECKSKFTGLNCDECKDEYYDVGAGCRRCSCSPSFSASAVCDKETGQCPCEEGHTYLNTRTCEKCPEAQFLEGGECVPCGCVPENTIGNSDLCSDDGQCDCSPDHVYRDERRCERCPPPTYLAPNGRCKDCGCFPIGSVTPICDERTGECTCKERYEGVKCGSCQDGFYDADEGCLTCNCDPENSASDICDKVTGQCECIEDNGPFVDPLRCGACAENSVLLNGRCQRCPAGTFVEDNVCTYCIDGTFFRDDLCEACECSEVGSVDNVCDPVSGVCTCKENYQGPHCQDCKDGFYKSGGVCVACECDPVNSGGAVCHKETGQCPCIASIAHFLDPRTCETCPDNHVVKGGVCEECPEGTFVHNNKCTYCPDEFFLGPDESCQDCSCPVIGSEDLICDPVTGVCDCEPGYIGDKCESCQDGYYRDGVLCIECACDPTHSRSSVCASDGQCPCIGDRPYVDERTCEACAEFQVVTGSTCRFCLAGTYFDNYRCEECLCDPKTVGTESCDVRNGACTCVAGFTGDTCTECEDGYFGPTCDRCNCGPAAASGVCDKGSGQCPCPSNYEGRTCEDCADGYYGDSCSPCGCVEGGAVCDKETGQCSCDPFPYYADPRTCERCGDNERLEGGRCVPCEPGTVLEGNICQPCPEGTYEREGVCLDCECSEAGTATCNRVTGSCECKARYEGPTCSDCREGWFGAPDCSPCTCDPLNSDGSPCRRSDGRCRCLDNSYLLDSRTCEQCPENQVLDDGECVACLEGYIVRDNTCVTCDDGFFYLFGQCEECKCNPKGSLSLVCDPFTGTCECDTIHEGVKCQNCKESYYLPVGSDECVPCGCVLENTMGYTPRCTADGRCYCKSGLDYVNPATCETCPQGTVVVGGACEECAEGTFYNGGECAPCQCSEAGSIGTCDTLSGVCTCKEGYTGANCDRCEDGYWRSGGKCVPCGCDESGSTSSVCNERTGQCPCRETSGYLDPRTCYNCPSGTYESNGECVDCNCGVGAASADCSADGTCTCLPNVLGVKCDECAEMTYGLADGDGCKPCGCNEYGVNKVGRGRRRKPDMTCDPVTGQCNCKGFYFDGEFARIQDKYESRTCDGCEPLTVYPYASYIDSETLECTKCRCNPDGGNPVCHFYTGECVCSPNIVGKYCDTRGCQWGNMIEVCVPESEGSCEGVIKLAQYEEVTKGGDYSSITKELPCDGVRYHNKSVADACDACNAA